jgi:hypothetical protein
MTLAKLAQAHPDVWRRIQARRDFMQDVLGIRLKPEILPFSNTAGIIQPFALDPNQAMVVAA